MRVAAFFSRLTKNTFLEGAKIRRQWRLENDSFPRPWMIEAQLPGVQHLARRATLFSIKGIANDRMPEMMKVHPKLVRPAAVQCAFHQAESTA